MHGRLKVKTTAQQEEEKNKERAKKSQQYIQAMKVLFQNRGDSSQNELVLATSYKILSANADVYTLWNIRKEILLQNKNEELYHKELALTQNCLLVNPKSYGVWNQRRFVMLNMGEPGWKEELALCNTFLQYDSRNFHCWDYRRFVVKQASETMESEIAFTQKKITENFSNYSAWHNRSQLYTKKSDAEIPLSLLKKELELVQNAVFTDPNDQSAWFYQRWLLGRRKTSVCLLSLALYERSRLVATFSEPVTITEVGGVVVDGNKSEVQWKSNHSNSQQWTCEFELKEDDVEIFLSLHPSFKINKNNGYRTIWTEKQDVNNLFFRKNNTRVSAEIIQNELESCQTLYELEPDNKWTMLTLVYLMQSTDVVKYESEALELLQKLIQCDSLRKGYYLDLRSKIKMECLLQKLYHEKNPMESINMKNMELTHLPYAAYFAACQTLDLRQNQNLKRLPANLLNNVKNILIDTSD